MTKLTFYGATEGMTGSICLLEIVSSSVLLEHGLQQDSHHGKTITFRSKKFQTTGSY
jgi:hypothetical protein